MCGAGYAGVFVTALLLGARERALPGILALTLGSQGALHLAFEAAGSASSTGPHGRAMPGMRMPVQHATLAHAAMPHMTGAHIAAALVASWWLRRGEAALWSLLRRAGTLVPGLLAWWHGPTAYAEAAPDPLRSAPRGTIRPPRQALLRHAVCRRGPPSWNPYPDTLN